MLQPVQFRNKQLPSKLRQICSAAMPNANTVRSDIALRTVTRSTNTPQPQPHYDECPTASAAICDPSRTIASINIRIIEIQGTCMS